MQVSVTGAGDLQRLSRRLRDAGKGDLNRKLRRGVTRAVTPLKAAVVAGLPTYVPTRYAGVLGPALKFRTSTTGDRVRITATAMGKRKERKVSAINAGVLRHPVYGNRKRWVAQRVKRGFFTEPLERGGPIVTAEITRVMEDVASKIAKG